MTNKFLLPIFALFFLVAGLISSAGYAQSNIFTKPLRKSSTPIPCQHSKLSQSSKSTIYKQIILFFINNGELQPKHVNYRTETIEPKYLEELNSPVYQEDFSKA